MSNNITSPPPPPLDSISSLKTKWGLITEFLPAAMYWFGYDFNVIPIGPASKITAVKWDHWLDGLSPLTIKDYWTEHPDHELGFIVGDDIIVFDADGPESVAALAEIEASSGMTPKIVVKTSKGEHHYYRRAADTVAKSDSHSSEKYPDRLDIKTGRALVILPPSTGKSLLVNTAEDKEELSEATQAFIDAIYEHNGRSAPSEVKAVPPLRSMDSQGEIDETSLSKLGALMKTVDPDCGYEDWRNVLMAVFHETQGSDDGLALVDAWSCNGKKYKGTKDIESKWKSFRLDVDRPVTIGTLIKMAKDAGANVAAILNDDAFELCEGEVVDIPVAAAPEKSTKTNDAAIPIVEASPKATDVKTPPSRYSMQDRVDELERQAMVQIPILGNIALLSQSTVIYAKPNTGKTLITLHLIIEAIKQGIINPSKLFYINMDDDSSGVIVKARLAEEYGFQMIADGYQDFEAKAFRVAMERMIETDTAKGVIVVLDTLKRFVDTMNKGKSRYFTKFTRKFSLKGGTVIALSHTNKNPDSNGKPVYSGTTDIVDDFDCAYTMSTILEQADNQKVVEFSNIKRRGNVALTEAYSYAQESNISYYERLLSVHKVDPDQLESTKHEAETKTDAEVITVITGCVINGITTKMELAAHAAERAKISKRCAIKIIEKYTGNDSAVHLWSFDVRERGAKVFKLLERPAEQSPTPPMATP